jgi:hypothetical protein
MEISHKHEMRQKMWEDQATTDPTNRFSEASRGHKQKESQTRNKQREYRRRK